MSIKKFMDKLTNIYEDFSNPQKLPSHNQQQQQYRQPGVYGIPQPFNELPLPPLPIDNNYNNYQIGIPGAYGDGINDDTIAFTNYVHSYVNSGIINIPPGNYFISKPIIIKSNNFQLIGSPQVKISCSFNSWSKKAESHGHVDENGFALALIGDNITIDSLNVTCVHPDAKSSCFLYQKGHKFLMKDCHIDEFNQGVIMGVIDDCSGKIPPNSYFYDLKIISNQITNVKGDIDGSIFFGDGIAFAGCGDVLISNNYISGKDGWTPRNGINSGPEGFEPSTNVRFLNNTVRGNWDYGLTTEGGNQCEVSYNDIEGASICAIIERGKDVKVIGNKINFTGRHVDGHCAPSAIQFYGVHTGELSNNTIYSPSGCIYGILIKPSHETAGGTNTLVENNTLHGDFFNGIQFSTAEIGKIYNNEIKSSNPEHSCVGLQIWYSNHLDIKNNNVDIPFGTACICSGSKNIKVVANDMMKSRCGFYICRGSDQVCINNNNLTCVTQTKFDQSDNNSEVSVYENYGIDNYSLPSNDNTTPNLNK